jgi:hypothetical protein
MPKPGTGAHVQPVGQSASAQKRVQRLDVASQSAVAHSEAALHGLPSAPVPARAHARISVLPSISGRQPSPGPQPPSMVHAWVHIGAMGASMLHAPLRQSTGPKAGQSAPMGSSPAMSKGGSQMGTLEPRVAAQVYAGRPVRRPGQSAALRQVAVQPRPGMQIPVAQSVAAVHGFSMSTQTFVPATSVHA